MTNRNHLSKPVRVPKNRVRVETNLYLNSHGKNPRGAQYGGWGYVLTDHVEDTNAAQETWHLGSYPETRKEAVNLAARLGYTTVTVLP